jgi:hypothetical protein
VTAATLFSFQSVITSAETGPVTPVSSATGTTQRKFGNMGSSSVNQVPRLRHALAKFMVFSVE